MLYSFFFQVWDRESGEDSNQYNLKPNFTDDVRGFKKETKNFRGYPYKAFLGWVSPDIQGEYLNVKDGSRLTVLASSIDYEETLHFFGGSTMWGANVSDKNTIPSNISKNLNIRAINYGEQAYNSRQELNLLLDKIDSFQTNDIVIFYDGVNDVYHNCRSHNSHNGHAREFFIKQKLSSNNQDQDNLLKNLSTYRFMKGLNKRLFSNNSSEIKLYANTCNNLENANDVANFLVNNWKSVESILNERNIKFVCGLQPNPYTFEGDIAYSLEEMKNQIRSVYPLIRKKAKNLSCFVDYSLSLSTDNYIDECCHLNEKGNLEVSKAISSSIRKHL